MLYLDIVFIFIFSAYLWWLWGLLRAFKSDAPYVPITRTVLERMMNMVEIPEGSKWIDLGSGDGRILIAAAKKFLIQGVGVELVSSIRILSKIKIFFAGLSSKIKIMKGDFFSLDLSQYDMISFYLLPETNKRLKEKIKKEAKPGTLLLYHRFPLEGFHMIAQDDEHKIYLARV